MVSRYDEDRWLEEVFGKWLDTHFYPSFPVRGAGSIQRVYHEAAQLRGADVCVKVNGRDMVIDEKAALHYINRDLPTFAFELLNRRSGAPGWLYKPQNITTHYLLAWPYAKDPDHIRAPEDFTCADIMLLERSGLIKLLAGDPYGLSERVLKQKTAEYEPQVTPDRYRFELAPGIALFFTERLAERPVNIVVRKNILHKIAIFHDVVK